MNAAACAFVETLEEVLRQGYPARFRASGWSMHPTIRDGETITIAPLGPSAIRPGEILLYRFGRAAIAHRVVRLSSVSGHGVHVILRGDAAAACDAPVPLGRMLGRVTTVGEPPRAVRPDLVTRLWSRLRARTIRGIRGLREMAAVLARPSEERS